MSAEIKECAVALAVYTASNIMYLALKSGSLRTVV